LYLVGILFPDVLEFVTSVFCVLLLQDFAYCYYRILFIIAALFCVLLLQYFVYCHYSILTLAPKARVCRL